MTNLFEEVENRCRTSQWTFFSQFTEREYSIAFNLSFWGNDWMLVKNRTGKWPFSSSQSNVRFQKFEISTQSLDYLLMTIQIVLQIQSIGEGDTKWSWELVPLSWDGTETRYGWFFSKPKFSCVRPSHHVFFAMKMVQIGSTENLKIMIAQQFH